MKISKIIKAVFAIFALIATANTANAQTSTVQATGTVLEPISFTSATNLAFGTSIYPGIDKSVAYSATGAASFDIDGEPGKQVTATFTLPTNLTHTTDGTSTLPISFGTTDAAHNTADDAATATGYDPSTTLTTTLAASTATTPGALFIWLGGTVSPASNQTAGAYAADVVLDVAYTGN